MKSLQFLYAITLLLFSSFSIFAQSEIVYESGSLLIKKLSDRVYTHVSYLQTEDFGNVPCNGMIVIDNQEVIVMETPINNEVSTELIDWIENELKAEIKAVIIHHFHQDCLGGLEVFHQKGIPSYSKNETIELAKQKGYTLPQNGLEKSMEFRLGDHNLISSYFGPAHTTDNIVTYFPAEKALFGGCMIKSLNASKGNLEDADVESWSVSVKKIKNKYPEIELVVPGHGLEGGINLLDYTIDLFEVN